MDNLMMCLNHPLIISMTPSLLKEGRSYYHYYYYYDYYPRGSLSSHDFTGLYCVLIKQCEISQQQPVRLNVGSWV